MQIRRAMTLAGTLCWVALCLCAPGARAQSLTLAGVLASLVQDAACAEERIVGLCRCAGLPCGVRVECYVPVAIAETARGPGDSWLAGTLDLAGVMAVVAGAGSTASSSLSATDNTAEAHVWALPAGPIPGLPCLGCTAGSASAIALVSDATAAVCGPADTVVRALGTAGAALAGPFVPHLAYASELDLLNWRTGCRDLANPSTRTALSNVACAVPGLQALAGAPGASCLGQWGALLPRQMRDIGPPPPLYAAKTAVRAMSIAHEQLGTLDYPVDTDGKLQQIHPGHSACFRVGELPLPQWPSAAAPVQLSSDGRYAWLYWRKTACCIAPQAAQQCLRLN